jgi:hypothetical protein
MDWKEILGLGAWLPLSTVEHLRLDLPNGIIKVGPDAYLRTQPHDRDLEMNRPGAPFVTMGYWTGSLPALERLIRGDPTVENGSVSACPPVELLLQTNGTFGELREMGMANRTLRSERAVYSNQGTFLYRVLDIERFTYCFYGRTDQANDRPFAIEVSLL